MICLVIGGFIIGTRFAPNANSEFKYELKLFIEDDSLATYAWTYDAIFVTSVIACSSDSGQPVKQRLADVDICNRPDINHS